MNRSAFSSVLSRSRTRLRLHTSTGDLVTKDPVGTLVDIWEAAVVVNGGTLTANSHALVTAFTAALVALPCFDKIVYLLPLLGSGIGAAQTPLIDAQAYGKAASLGFVSTDFSETTGLKGNGSSKRFDIPTKSGTLINVYGGFGLFYGLRYFSNVSPNLPCTSYNSSGNITGGFTVYPASTSFFSRGANVLTGALRAASSAAASTVGNYYGQDGDGTTSAAIAIYKNGTELTTTKSTGAVTAYPENSLGLLGCSYSSGSWWSADRVGCYAITTGHLTATEVAQLNSCINDYLYTPTGR